MDIYRNLASDYDALNPKEGIFKQESFFRRTIGQSATQTCLDCACGTGWHLYMLDKLGLSCAGSDLSERMVRAARRNLSESKVMVKREDFRSLSRSWKQKFDMVLCLTTSLPHMLTNRDAVAALRSMKSRLRPNGVLVISNGISDAMLDSKPGFIVGREGEDQAFYFFLEHPNSRRVIFNIILVKRTPRGFSHTREVIEYNAMRKSTFEKLFERVPFSQVEYYGGYDFSPYSKTESPRLIVVARR